MTGHDINQLNLSCNFNHGRKLDFKGGKKDKMKSDKTDVNI